MVNSGRPRTDIVLATKVFGAIGKGPNDRGASRGHIMDGVKASLKRLGTDYIDLYQIHGLDKLDSGRGDRARAGRPRAPGPCALCRLLQLGGLEDHAGARHRRQSRLDALRLAAGLLHHLSPALARIAFSIWPAISGLSRRNCLAFSRPWPRRWLS